jgi:hypothetical protein
LKSLAHACESNVQYDSQLPVLPVLGAAELPQWPSPPGPVCEQCVSGSRSALYEWYLRQATVLPL